MAADSYHKIFSNKQTIMVIMAHPDDLEAFCGATVARLVADGKRVISIKITSGNRGSKGASISPAKLAQARREEDAASMRLLGVPPEDSIHLMFNDGEVENSLTIIEKLALQIRTYQPELIITTNPEHVIVRHSPGTSWINHRDHRNAAMCAIDAAYPYSRDSLFFPEHFDQGVCAGQCMEFLIADSWDNIDEVFIDAKGFLDKKLACIRCHKSQMTEASSQRQFDLYTRHNGINGAYEKFRHVITS